MQTALIKIWTRVTKSTSYGGNCYTMSISNTQVVLITYFISFYLKLNTSNAIWWYLQSINSLFFAIDLYIGPVI